MNYREEEKMNYQKLLTIVVLAIGILLFNSPIRAEKAVTYNTVKIDGLDIFYREAGDRTKPTILLLHGFPTSSFMFRNLIPQLADNFHVVAPDYPGFGQSSMPKVGEFEYSFENLANIVDKFTQELNLNKYSLYV